ncbi:hypothetical protein BS50DRAFT_149572 [Corynespora cassiicola Philippines]|uniref:Uncharacterized protein n=1 Tax=Corynespora cassiicola Philippines TaxID=1448308 RepID=A0A2T2N8M6_CORCC|nr:hypothetical protein BS50DRAFT_149572 [Corynespora cassiicola Philippines]
MARPKAITISKPFDARHVAGVSVPGAAMPIAGVQRSFTSSLVPDEAPIHTNVATGTTEIKRSNSIASSLSRPSLRLKTSISRLRSRSSSNSPETLRKRGTATPDASDPETMSVHSLRMRPSMTRLRARVGLHKDSNEELVAPQRQKQEDVPPAPLPKDAPKLALKTSSVYPSAYRTASPDEYRPPPPPPPPPQEFHIPKSRGHAGAAQSLPRKPSQRYQPQHQPQQVPVRPKRADSGTAIDFRDVPVEERPLGFKEIQTVRSFSERMALYKKTREFWASADHGLEEWVGRAGGPKARPIAFQI